MRDQEILGLVGAYASIYSNLSESHFKVGDEVICKNSGMEGEVVKVDSEEKGKYYTVKREDGKMVKYAPDELKLEDEKEDMKEAKNGGVSKKKEEKFHTKLDKLVHSTFGSSPEEEKMKEEFDIFDVILEHLVAEGYADTNQAALAIMANMSEEWKQDIVEAAKDQSNKQIEKGVKTTYKAGNVLDNQHQGRSRGLNRLSSTEREEKTKRMRRRLKSRRDDLFGERNRREDEAGAELKKRLGL